MRKKNFIPAFALITFVIITVLAQTNSKVLPFWWITKTAEAAEEVTVSNSVTSNKGQTAINTEISGNKTSETKLFADQTEQGPVSKTAESFAVSPGLKSLPEVMNGAFAFGDAVKFPVETAVQALAPQAMPTPSLTIEGISGSDVFNIYNNTLAPPSMVGEAGLNHYVQAVNYDVFRIYDKGTGAPVTAITKIAALFSGFPINNPCRRDTFDSFAPIWQLMVNYDQLADRWIISRFGGPQVRDICIAVSQTGDPTGSWNIYHFKTPVNKEVNLTQMGVWTDGYYFSAVECFQGNCDTVGLYALNREKMISGDATASFVYFSRPLSSTSVPLPADADGYAPPPAGSPEIFFEMDADEFGTGRTDSLLSYEFVPNFANPANSTLTAKPAVPVAAFDPRDPTGRTDIEQPTQSYRNLDSHSGRLMYRAAYRNLGTVSNPVNSYVMNWTVNISGAAPTDAGTYQAAPRWTELRRSAAGALSVFDQGTHAPDPVSGTGRNRWLGSIAQDNQGNLALGFSRSGPVAGEFPDIVWAGRTGGQTAAGTLNEGEATMFASTGYQGGFGSNTTSHWGFYSMMTVDPSDNCTFWYTNEYRIAANEGDLNLNPFRWNTRIGKFKFPTCAAAPRGQIAANVTYCSTGAPVNNSRVAANAGNFIRTTNASGSLISNIIAAPGTYTVSAGKDNLLPASTASTSATVVDGSLTPVNLCLNGVDVDATTLAITNETCALNNAADPGETMTVNLGLKFVEGNPTSNLTATLLPTGGVTNPNAPQNYGSLPTDGTPSTRSFTFTVAQNVVPETTITLTLELTDGSSNLGIVTYTIPVGRKNDPGQGFDYASEPVTVPATEEITTTVNVSGVSDTIEDLDFVITEKVVNNSTAPGIWHSRIGELELNLTSPQGTTVRLMFLMKGVTGNLAGCWSDSILNTTLDDSATVLVDDACPGESDTSGPLTGRFKPNSPLSAFNGENPNGTWTLKVKDWFAGHFGALYGYRLVFKSFQPETCSGANTCVQAPSGMVGWYPGDGNANDISSIANHGTMMNGATFANGMVGQAFSLDGVNDFVQMPSNSLQDPTTAATLDAWVRFNQTPSQAGRIMEIITKGAFNNDLDLGALTNDRFVLYVRSSSGVVTSTTIIQPNVWYHVAGTWDSTGLRMYVNGVLENTNLIQNLTRTTTNIPLRIGNGGDFDRNTLYFSGLIDEAEIFNRALSASEIQAIYNAGSAGKCKTSAGSGLEADVAPRPDGNGSVNAGDVTQVQRFAVGLDQPFLTNEFQRADCAPRLAADNTTQLLGNGSINSGDVTQAQRYAVGLDGTPPPAGGPTSPGGSKPALFYEGNKQKIDFLFNRNLIFSSESAKSAQATYEVRAIRESLTATTLTVAIRLDTDASAAILAASVGGTLRFNQTQLSNPTNIRLGSGAPVGTSFFANTADTANGRLGFTINAPVNQTFATGEQKLLLIDFTVIGTGATTLSFDSSQAQRFVGDVQGNELTNSVFPPTEISLSPTAATVSVSGRVLAKGRGVARARISIISPSGKVGTTTTNSFGYFRFEGVSAGETYIFEVKDKRYRFANNPRILFIGEDFADLNFTALP